MKIESLTKFLAPRATDRAVATILAAFSLLALSMMATTVARAQGMQLSPAQIQQIQQRQQAAIEKELGITAAQKAKLQSIQQKYTPKLQAIQQKYAPQAQALQKQLYDLQMKMNAEARPVVTAMQKEQQAVLTPQQKAKLESMRQQAMRGQMGGVAPAPKK